MACRRSRTDGQGHDDGQGEVESRGEGLDKGCEAMGARKATVVHSVMVLPTQPPPLRWRGGFLLTLFLLAQRQTVGAD